MPKPLIKPAALLYTDIDLSEEVVARAFINYCNVYVSENFMRNISIGFSSFA